MVFKLSTIFLSVLKYYTSCHCHCLQAPQNMLLMISHGGLNDIYSTYMNEGFILVYALGFKEMKITDFKHEI